MPDFLSSTPASASPHLPDVPGVWSGAQWQHGAQVQALSTGHAALDTQLPGGGWPLGAMSEILLPEHGLGPWTLLAPALAELTTAYLTRGAIDNEVMRCA